MCLAMVLALSASCSMSKHRIDDSADAGPVIPIEPVLLHPIVRTADCFESPEDELVSNLVDALQETKFLAFSRTAWVYLELPSPVVVTEYALTAADDFPERDPARWVLQGSNDGKIWRPVDSRQTETFAERYERHSYEIEAAPAYRYFYLSLENSGGYSVQLAELELYGVDAIAQSSAAIPAAPTNLTTSEVGRRQARLIWSGSSTESAYTRIEESSDGASWSIFSYVAPDEEEWVSPVLDEGLHYFRVVAESAGGTSAPSNAVQKQIVAPNRSTVNGKTEYSDQGYTLVVDDFDGTVSPEYERSIVEEFFISYPTMAEEFNPAAVRVVNLNFDPALASASKASGSTITVSSGWVKDFPNDLDVISHSGFDVLQSYDKTVERPYWIVTGLADYARYVHGRNNREACWSLRSYLPTADYTYGFKRAARFFLWLENGVAPGVTFKLAAALRDNSYVDGFWMAQTGKTIDALWMDYGAAVHEAVVYP